MRKSVVIPEKEYREQWFRIEAREHKRTLLTLKKGTNVIFSQIIARAGYFWEPDDMPVDLQVERAKLLLEETIKRKTGEVVTRRMVDEFLNSLDLTSENQALRHLMYKVRGTWLKEMRGNSERLRTFWYVNYANCYQYRPYQGTISAIKTKWIGLTYSCSGSYTWDGDYDYTPGGMENPLFQQVYLVDLGWQTLMVHPLDIIEGNNNGR